MEIQIVSLSQSAVVEATAVQLTTSHGQIQVLDQHADMVSVVLPGRVNLTDAELRHGSLSHGEEAEFNIRQEVLFAGHGYLRFAEGKASLMLDRLLVGNEVGRERARARLQLLSAKGLLSGEEEREHNVLEQFLQAI